MNKAPQQVTQFSGGILRFDDGTVGKLDASGKVPQAKVPASQINILKQADVTAEQLAADNAAAKKAAEAKAAADAKAKAEADALAAQKAEEAAAAAQAEADAAAAAAAKADPNAKTPSATK
jgi:colicin import membrane protein